ncbi:hypothetical protein BJY21_004051 [Kineosphaera limosa]|uniref:Addiction module component n=1 Tax=Kineosphaera limosa NBRC 100340 TaxID=1184609 RepID=K6VDQ1_9MICO|nr:addiction module protein [Kineosphaera limosa]NYE02867.1 hypothetical protein [Kineosphaera limosa]GAB94298.1 hypothetical protein KILIM_004_00890 [Kineosphaera limosa NBRC 100340]
MTHTLAEYLEAGYCLAPQERLEAARMLRLSVHQDQTAMPDDIEAEWDAVITRRVDEILGGTVQAVDGAESFARIHARLDALDRPRRNSPQPQSGTRAGSVASAVS